MLSRREWVKCFALGFVTSSATRHTTLADISAAVNQANIISLKVADFPALQVNYGSVRLALLPGANVSTVDETHLIVTRGEGNVFFAVSARCTHERNLANPYDHFPGQRAIICEVHNSLFSIDGKIISPAQTDPPQRDLTSYNTSFAEGILRIEVPSMNFKLNTFAVQTPGDTTRLALNFQRRAGGRYRVLYTPNLSTSPMPVDFATSSTGPLNRGPSFSTPFFINNTSPVGQATAAQTLWVDSTAERGFYLVELVITQDAVSFPP